MFILPYKNGSRGAGDLAEAIGAKQIKREGSKFRGSKDKIVINWGSTTMSEEVAKCEVINKPEAVALASNKLSFFNAIAAYNRKKIGRINIPAFFTDKEEAREYIFAGHIIVARTILNGHSGAGIVLCETSDELDMVNAPLYVLYQPKKQEYRIHVLHDEVVDIQRKARRTETPDDQVNWKIRNHDNGFIYSRNENMDNLHPKILTDSINAVKVCGLDFGAVDVIYNEKTNTPYVLEVNTAPGLSGETLAGYASRMKELGSVRKIKPTSKSLVEDFVPNELIAAEPAAFAVNHFQWQDIPEAPEQRVFQRQLRERQAQAVQRIWNAGIPPRAR